MLSSLVVVAVEFIDLDNRGWLLIWANGHSRRRSRLLREQPRQSISPGLEAQLHSKRPLWGRLSASRPDAARSYPAASAHSFIPKARGGAGKASPWGLVLEMVSGIE